MGPNPRVVVRVGTALFGLALCASLASAQNRVQVDTSSLALTPTPTDAVPLSLKQGQVQVVITLADAPLAKAVGANAKRVGIGWTKNQQQAYLSQLNSKQSALMSQVSAMGGKEIARLSKSHNAVVAQVDAQRIPAISQLAGVVNVRPVINYQIALSDTVPYIGAAFLQQHGIDGTGVKVAVLDSGIDYTHANLSGSGLLADYTACYGTAPSDPRNKTIGPDCHYPTSKVVGGYDFVGEAWNGTAASPPLAPDPNPIGAPAPGVLPFPGLDGSHGTHVADIIGGKSVAPNPPHVGVAPGTLLYAVKVCSSVSTACSGVALLEGIEFALDPNGDGDISDAVDVINMSLGSNYGQFEDDLSEASAVASQFGIVVVAAAGNAGDRPYIVSSPSTTPEVISVAQTQVPSAKAFPLIINAPASIAGSYPNTATVDWAPISSAVTGNVAVLGRGCPTGSISPGSPADTYLDNPSGKVALIDRGACAVSLKVDRAAKAGAIGVLIGLVAAGDAVSFSFGGGDTFVPTLVIIKSYADLIKANAAAPVNVTYSPSISIPLAGSMVGSSARGPSYSYQAIKPDIGAPGASVSAVSGTGTGEAAFGGTSGATPMIAGSAALLLSANHSLSPQEVKALLMNSAETNIQINPATEPGVLAEISRIGGGEVRVDRANKLTAAAWDADNPVAVGLSFGYNPTTGNGQIKKNVTVHNYAGTARTFSIAPSFRFPGDSSSGAVSISAPASISVPAHGSASFAMILKIDASKLPVWPWDGPGTISFGGMLGGDGPTLTAGEFDGYVTFADAADTFHLPWHVLPRKSADVNVASSSIQLSGGTGSIGISNAGGAVDGAVDTFALTGTNGRVPTPALPQAGDNFAVIDLKAVGVRQAGQTVQFAINTFGQRSHPAYPAEFDIYIDVDNDGNPDYVVFNLENGGFGATGQTVVAVLNLATGKAAVVSFANADLDSGNMIMTVPLSALGLAAGQKFNFAVYAFDNYFTGNLTDAIGPMTFTLGTPRFATDGGTGLASFIVPQGASGAIGVNAVANGASASSSQTGILFMYRDAKNGWGADPVTVTP